MKPTTSIFAGKGFLSAVPLFRSAVLSIIFTFSAVVALSVLVKPVSAIIPDVLGVNLGTGAFEVSFTGELAAARTGEVIVNIGDINDDGNNDIAITAPLAGESVWYSPSGDVAGQPEVVDAFYSTSIDWDDTFRLSMNTEYPDDPGTYLDQNNSLFLLYVAYEYGYNDISFVQWSDGNTSGNSANFICATSNGDYRMAAYYVHVSETQLNTTASENLEFNVGFGDWDALAGQVVLQGYIIDKVTSTSPLSDSDCTFGTSTTAESNVYTSATQIAVSSAIMEYNEGSYQNAFESIALANVETDNLTSSSDVFANLVANLTFSSGYAPGVQDDFDFNWPITTLNNPFDSIQQAGWAVITAVFEYGATEAKDPQVSLSSATNQLVIGGLSFDNSTFVDNTSPGAFSMLANGDNWSNLGWHVGEMEGLGTTNITWQMDDAAYEWAVGAVSLNRQCPIGSSYEILDSPGPYDWSSDTYNDSWWYEVYVDAGEDISTVNLIFDYYTDIFPEEGDVYLMSPDSNTVQVIDGVNFTADTTTPVQVSFTDFEFDSTSEGNWRIWITDSYGDGGHQITNATISFGEIVDPCPLESAPAITSWDFDAGESDTSEPWLSLDYIEGNYLLNIVKYYSPTLETITFFQHSNVIEGATQICSSMSEAGYGIAIYGTPIDTDSTDAYTINFSDTVQYAIFTAEVENVKLSDPVVDFDCTNYSEFGINYLPPEIEVHNGSSLYTLNSTTSNATFSFETVSAVDSALAVFVNYRNPFGAEDVYEVLFNGSYLIEACEQGEQEYWTAAYYMTDPDVGEYDVEVNWSSDIDSPVVMVVQVSGVDQADPLSGISCGSGTAGWDGSETPTAISTTVASGENHLVVATTEQYSGGFPTLTPNSGQTALYSTQLVGASASAGAYKVSTGNSTTIGWESNFFWPWGIAALSFNPSLDDSSLPFIPPVLVGGTNSGKLYIVGGSNSFASSNTLPNGVIASFIGEEENDYLGRSDRDTYGFKTVAGIGDVNGDGIDDFAVASTSHDSNRGKVYVFFGKSTGWGINRPVSTADVILTGVATGDRAGFSIAGVGDLNGDGYDDFVVSAPYRDANSLTDNGEVYVIRGRTTAAWDAEISLSTQQPSYYGNKTNDRIGFSLAGLGHVGSSSRPDFAIGAPFADYKMGATDTGFLYVVFGADSLPFSSVNIVGASGVSNFEGEENNDNLGWDVARLYSFNGNERNNIAVSAPGHSTNISDDGIVYVVNGLLSGTWTSGLDIDFHESYSFVGTCNNCRFGSQVSALDLDNDGRYDLLVRSDRNLSDTNPEVHHIFGATATWLTNQSATAAVHGSFRIAGLYWVSSGGRVNNDSFDDIMMSVPTHSSSLGRSYIGYGGSRPTPPAGDALDSAPGVVGTPQVVVKPDGFFLISFSHTDYADDPPTTDMYFVGCLDEDCDDKTNTNGLLAFQPDQIDGRYGIVLWMNPTTNRPLVIGRNKGTPNNLMIMEAANANFTALDDTHIDILTPVGGAGAELQNISGAIRSDGRPFIVWGNMFAGGGSLFGMRCTNDICTSGTPVVIDAPAGGPTYGNSSNSAAVEDNRRNAAGGDGQISVALLPGNIPVISKYNFETNSVELIVCSDQDCSSMTRRVLNTGPGSRDVVGAWGAWNTVFVRPDGTPAVLYSTPEGTVNQPTALDPDAMRLYSCANASCSSGVDNIIYDNFFSTAAGSAANVAIDEFGFPLIQSRFARGRTAGDYHVYRCYNAECTEGRFRTLKEENEEIRIPDSTLRYNPGTGRYTIVYTRQLTSSNWEAHLINEVPPTFSSITNLAGTLQARQLSRVNPLNALTVTQANPQTQNFATATVDIRLQTSSAVPIADFEVTFADLANLNWSAVSGDSDAGGRAVVSIIGNPGVGTTHTLYVPKLPMHTALVICPNAVTLGELSESCSGNYVVTESMSNVSIVNIGGQPYWKVDGLTGTGGLGTGNTISTYIDLTAQPATNPMIIATPPEVAVSTTDEFYLSYIPESTEFGAGNIVDIVVPQDFDNLGLCASSTTDADGDSTPDGSMSVINDQIIRFTFSASTTQALATGVEFCFSTTTAPTPGNYSIAVSDTNDGNFSAALIYVGDDNDVTVTATVPATLSLRIKEATTLDDTNVCELGILNPGSVNSCVYRIAAGTNATAGLQVYIIADADLNNAGDTENIVATGVNTNVVAGSEGYGVRLTLGTGFSIGGAFSTIFDNPVPLVETLLVEANAAVNDNLPANWSSVTHRASVSAATAADLYDQIVTYRVWVNT